MSKNIFDNNNFILESIGGNCPVQGEGKYNGYDWYFRSRWDTWYLTIASKKGVDALSDSEAFFYSELWGEEPGEAGWMPEEIAQECINKAFQVYLNKNY